MKRNPTMFLKTVVLLIAAGSLVAMVLEPQFEGRNINSNFMDIYFRDPFLAYMYLTSIPFFVALYNAFKLLGHIDKNKIFSTVSVKAVRNIKYCAAIVAAFITGSVSYLFIFVRGKDDIAGGVALGLVTIFASSVVATAAAVFQKLLQNAVDIKSENDLTV